MLNPSNTVGLAEATAPNTSFGLVQKKLQDDEKSRAEARWNEEFWRFQDEFALTILALCEQIDDLKAEVDELKTQDQGVDFSHNI